MHGWRGKLLRVNLVKPWQDFFCVIDAAGLCVFYSVRNLSNLELDILPTGILELINAATANLTKSSLPEMSSFLSPK